MAHLIRLDEAAYSQICAAANIGVRHCKYRCPATTAKPTDEWTTGDEAMTGAQASYLKTLCEEAGEPFDPEISKAEASRRIDALQDRTGRGA